MRRVLKWLGIFLGLVVVCLVLAAIGIYFTANNTLNEEYDVEVETLTIPSDEESIARGEYLVYALGSCWHCHGDDLSGGEVINDNMVAVIEAPNLTSGEGGVGAEFTDEDWVRAIRHGVDPDGKGLFIMPSKDYARFTDEDLAAVIAYLKSLQPVDNETEPFSIGPVGYVMVVSASDDLIAAKTLDHDADHPESIEPEVSAEYGEYLVSIACMGCHQENLAGGESIAPGEPAPANLTPGGIMEGYDLETFTHFLRTGESFAGRQIDDDNMPWTSFQRLTDDDIEAILLYIQSVPAVEEG